jgi:O-antigen ligase
MPPLYRLLVVTVALAPLPFASAPVVAWSALAIVVGILVAGWGIEVLRGRETPIGWRIVVPVGMPFAFAVAWAAFQGSTLSPPGLHHPLWSEAAAALRVETISSISLDRFATGSALTRLLTYGGVFWLALHYGRVRSRAEFALLALVVAGSAYAMYGIFEFLGPNRILGYEKTAYTESLTSTFINRNHYATFAGLLLLCTTALLAGSVLEPMREHPPPSRPATAWRRAEDVLTVRNALLMSAWMFQCTALYLTGSRAGIASSIAGLLVLTIAITAVRVARRSVRAGILATCCLALFFAFVQSGGSFSERLMTASAEFVERQNVYRISAGLIAERPILGTGYGTFADAFRTRRDVSVNNVYDKAHNTYLENGVELGVPGELLLFIATISAFLGCLLGARASNPGRGISCVGVGATTLVGLHALVDFGVQIPAVAVIFAFLLGTALAQSVRVVPTMTEM